MKPFLVCHRVGDEKVDIANIHYLHFKKYYNKGEKRMMVVV